jgi:hypothetical protein
LQHLVEEILDARLETPCDSVVYRVIVAVGVSDRPREPACGDSSGKWPQAVGPNLKPKQPRSN